MSLCYSLIFKLENIKTTKRYQENNTNLPYFKSPTSQSSSSIKIKHVTSVSVKSKFIHQDVRLTYNRIETGLKLLYDKWKVLIIIKDYFKEYRCHDIIVEPINDDLSTHNLETLLLAVFKKKNNSYNENDIYSTFDLLSCGILKKIHLA